jgi:hypothetical protein
MPKRPLPPCVITARVMGFLFFRSFPLVLTPAPPRVRSRTVAPSLFRVWDTVIWIVSPGTARPGALTTLVGPSYAWRPVDNDPLVQIASANPPPELGAKTEPASEMTTLTPMDEFPVGGQMIDGMTRVAVMLAACFFEGGAGAV